MLATANQTFSSLIPARADGGKPEIVEFKDSWPEVHFADTGLVFTEKLDRPTWMKVGRYCAAVNRRSKLWLADWILENDRRGWEYSYDDLVNITGLEKETLWNYASIGRRVPHANRIAGNRMSWYAAVAALPAHQQVAVLRQALDDDWARDDIRERVKQLLTPPAPQLPSLINIADVPPFPFEVDDDMREFADDMELTANLTPREVGEEEYHLGSQEWFTPEDIAQRATRALGGCIDLDPASCATANQVIGATRYYTKEDNGLAQHWEGTVYMNPPYTTGLVDLFVDKLMDSYKAGDVPAAVTLLNNATETGWGQRLLNTASAICFVSGRVKYWTTLRDEYPGPRQGQMIAYFGDQIDTFQAEFSEVGTIWIK